MKISLKSKIGVYRIYNIFDGKSYIGSSVSLNKRLSEHLRNLRSGTHHSTHLQRAFNKYGEESFSLEILEYCNKEDLLIKEQYYLNLEQSFDRLQGYNICEIAGNTMGHKHSIETRTKMSITRNKRAGIPHTDETKKKIRRIVAARSQEIKTRIGESVRRYYRNKKADQCRLV